MNAIILIWNNEIKEFQGQQNTDGGFSARSPARLQLPRANWLATGTIFFIRAQSAIFATSLGRQSNSEAVIIDKEWN